MEPVDSRNDSKEGPSIFISKNGTIRSPAFLLLASLPLFFTGRWMWGLIAVVTCLLLSMCFAMDELQEEDKQEIRYNVMTADDILYEMESFEKQSEDKDQGRLIVLTGLGALAKKYGRQHQPPNPDPEGLALLCQQAGYVGLRNFPMDDPVVAASLSLLALVAKKSNVRERHIYQADNYGLDSPINCMRQALMRAQKEENQAIELQAAELQRKGCLMLGALADGDVEMARLIVQEGGLEAILEAVNWYRYHADVANWALWAIFILCYENIPNKAVVAQLDGVSIVIQTMRNCPDSLEVARHGTAILFDLMRENEDNSDNILDVWKIRNVALNAGLHEVIANAMNKFSDAMDIMMMGQELLIGTGYEESVPEFHPKDSDE